MFKPAEMNKVLVIGNKKVENEIIEELYEMGIMEIKPLELEKIKRGKVHRIHDIISFELIRVRALINILFPFFSKFREPLQIPVKLDAEKVLNECREFQQLKIDEKIKEVFEKRQKVLSRKLELERAKETILKLKDFKEVNFENLTTKNFTFIVGEIESKVYSSFVKDLEKFIGKEKILLLKSDQKNYTVVLLFYPKNVNLDFILQHFNFRKLEISNIKNYNYMLKEIEEEETQLKSELEKLEKELASLGEKFLPLLTKLEFELALLANREAISAKFAKSENLFLICGWVKKSDMRKLYELSEKYKNIEIVELEDKKDAPTVLENPTQASQFEWLVKFYSLPKYGEIDPTLILMFTFSFIYGMIVGDVIYGLFSAVFSHFLSQKFKDGMLGNVAKIWFFSSISAIFFGLVYDEWLGLTHVSFINLLNKNGIPIVLEKPLYYGISRSHHLDAVLFLSLIVGLIHLTLGYLLGFINEFHHNKKHAFAKIAWIFLLYGAVGFIFLPKEISFLSLILILGGLAYIFYAEGFIGIFEVSGLISNLLSYSRIAAAGVVGVILAEIINTSFSPSLGALFLLPLFLFLHFLNMVLAMFESLVQGARLNLVEFYSKFFHGGGRAFEPFSIKNALLHVHEKHYIQKR